MTALIGRAQAIGAPPWQISEWLNTEPIALRDLRGRVVVLEVFQMLCPGCVAEALPQAQRIGRVFGEDIALIGLHSVFEHHDAMTPVALAAFAHEYRLRFPIGIDEHDADRTPMTFTEYGMRGTPTTLLIDKWGRIRAHRLGMTDDMSLGADLARLIAEEPAARS